MSSFVYFIWILSIDYKKGSDFIQNKTISIPNTLSNYHHKKIFNFNDLRLMFIVSEKQ